MNLKGIQIQVICSDFSQFRFYESSFILFSQYSNLVL